jgi:hypothetical protein
LAGVFLRDESEMRTHDACHSTLVIPEWRTGWQRRPRYSPNSRQCWLHHHAISCSAARPQVRAAAVCRYLDRRGWAVIPVVQPCNRVTLVTRLLAVGQGRSALRVVTSKKHPRSVQLLVSTDLDGKIRELSPCSRQPEPERLSLAEQRDRSQTTKRRGRPASVAEPHG